MSKRMAIGMAFLGLCTAAPAQTTTAMTHVELQAVDSVGYGADPTNYPFIIQGVLISDPEEMLDSAFKPEATNPSNGGQYQTFIQATAPGDRGGTALYMAQMSFVGDNYDAPTWSNEMQRIMMGAGNRKFRKGDLIEVTARKTLFFGGKRNINEAHRTSVSNNFDLRLVQANVGVPQAEAVKLSDLVNVDGSSIFDASRATGGERWQGLRVRLDGIRLATTNGWGKTNWSDRICMAADAAGRLFPLRMPRTLLSAPPATSTWISAVGILNQESGSGTTGTNGYELFVQEIGPELDLGRTSAGGIAVHFSSDYEGYVLEASEDGQQTWSPVDATPQKRIVIEDAGASSNRAYRLIKKDN
jgi:hypothetical protein